MQLQKLRGGKHSSLLRCLPQMEPREVDLLKKLICKDDSTSATDNSREIKRHLYSMAEDEYSKSDEVSFEEREKRETKQSANETATSNELDAAARTIQKAYRTYSRRKIRSSIETTKSQTKTKQMKKTRSDPSLPAGLLRSSTHPAG